MNRNDWVTCAFGSTVVCDGDYRLALVSMLATNGRVPGLLRPRAMRLGYSQP
jgi:hypothetical protein